MMYLSVFLVGIFFNIIPSRFSDKLNAAEPKKDSRSEFLPIKDELKKSIEKKFELATDWPEIIEVEKKKAKIEYNFNSDLDAYIKKLLKSYRSDYSTVAVIDNETGSVLAAVGLEGKKNKFNTNLILSSTHPSASLIKIITTAELLANTKVTRETTFDFKGKSTTLFKYQLKESKNNRWDKTQTLETAFAKSNNVVFGKAAIQNTSSEKLIQMAESFGFNRAYVQEFDFLRSHIELASDDYSLAEMASGYNDTTLISPIHAAMMASIIANNGVMKNPQLISKISDVETGELLWSNSIAERRVLSPEVAAQMQEIMGGTIDGGTARKSFRRMNTGYKNAIEIGGKTGSITGGEPFGKRDWFAAFAIPRDAERGKGISISVMNVNVKKWHVKSTMLAKDIIEYYYNNVKPVPITMIKMNRHLSAHQVKSKNKRERKIASAKISQRSKKKTIKPSSKKIGRRNERKSKTRI